MQQEAHHKTQKVIKRFLVIYQFIPRAICQGNLNPR
uniref:Uncharacterized protein n=1 Tax=Rhizophora mucronata TaxID=61149 RepID=A0A2P2R4R8_RHIMU